MTANGQQQAASGPGPPGRSTLMRVTLLAGPVLSMVDSSVVNVAVPVIVRDLHTTLGAASWTVSGYLLGLAGGLAATPWLARRFGTMRSYTAVLLGFTLASAACALAPDVGLLITMRVVQGLVGAPMVPLDLFRETADKSQVQAPFPGRLGPVQDFILLRLDAGKMVGHQLASIDMRFRFRAASTSHAAF